MKLKEYKDKRDFSSTSEPSGKSKKAGKDLIFVIQYHKARAKHYDFRLEWKGVLLSWAVPKGPSYNPQDKRLAVHVEDHPVDYANFEGIIPEGNYGAGSVEIFDSGTYEPSFDMDYGLKKGHLKFVLHGKKFEGEWSLVRIDDKNWLLIKSQDEYARARTARTKTARLPFKKADVQLATLTKQIPKGKDWLFEIKYDGFRLLSFVEKGKVKCLTRGGQDYTHKFEAIAADLGKIDEESFVVDGEVVIFDKNGRSDFGLLQEGIKSQSDQMIYVIFDLLALNGEDLRQKPLVERKKLLKRLFSKPRQHLMFSEHVEGKGKECFDFAKKNHLEGIIAKKADSLYAGKRNNDWLKIKCYCRQEFVVCGYTTTEKNQVLSALLLAYYRDGKLVYVGKVGTGFDEKDRQMLSPKLEKIATKKSQIDILPDGTKLDATYVKPTLVAEIQFAGLTKDGVLRQPSFVGLRQDKPAKSVKLEVADENPVN